MASTEVERETVMVESEAAGDSWATVSVIVPTRNRASYLKSLLAAVSAQVYPSSKMEVVVVDNSSTDDTEAVVREYATQVPFPVRYLRKADRGPAAARNLGVSVSTGELLAFTDSDCLPGPLWLRSSVMKLGENDGLVCGPIVPVPVATDSLLVHQVFPTYRDEGIYPTANVVYRRSAFEKVGGFAEGFGAYPWGTPVGGEDTDLAWRVKRAGYGATFAGQAVVYHQASPLSIAKGLLGPIQVQILPRLLRTVPELRSTFLWRRYFVGPHTASFYPLVVGLALVRRTRWSLLLTLPWLRIFWPGLRPEIWPPRRWRRFASRLALMFQTSTILALVLAWASLRYRRLVL